MYISDKGNNIAPSLTLAISAKAKEMISNGIDLVNFTVGEPDFETPQYIKEGAIKAINEGKTRYTAASGIPELKSAICKKFKDFNNLDYKNENIIVSTGAKQTIVTALMSILNPEDEVIIPSPYWLSYPEMVKIADGTPIIVDADKENNFKITIELLDANYTEKTKCLILNNPSNPLGIVYTEEELKKIASWAVEHKVIVLSDEIYEDLVYEGKHVSIAKFNDDIKDLTITVSGFSKSYAMTGWRLGYCAARPDIIKTMSSFQSHMTSNPSSISQYAGLTALIEDDGSKAEMIKHFIRRRNLVKDLIEKTPLLSVVEPKGAFYAFIDISHIKGQRIGSKEIKDSFDVANILLLDYQVALLPGFVFGNDDYIRVSYATSDEIIERGFERINQFVKDLQTQNS